MPPKKVNGNEPATQKDLSLVAGQLTTRLDQIEKNMATKTDINRLDNKVSRLDNKVSRLDNKVSRIDDKVSRIDDKVSRLDNKVTDLEKGQASLKNSQAAILKVVNSIDQQLQEHKTHPTPISRLERATFPR